MFLDIFLGRSFGLLFVFGNAIVSRELFLGSLLPLGLLVFGLLAWRRRTLVKQLDVLASPMVVNDLLDYAADSGGDQHTLCDGYLGVVRVT